MVTNSSVDTANRHTPITIIGLRPIVSLARPRSHENAKVPT